MMKESLLGRSIYILVFLFLVFGALYYAKNFLIPIAFAGILAMLLLPVSRRLENLGLHRGLAIFLCLLLLIAVITGILMLLSWQVSDLTKDVGELKSRLKEFLSEVQQFINHKFGISKDQQKSIINNQQSSGGAQSASIGFSIINFVMGFITNFVLVFVYIFLLTYFRTHLKNFILRLVPANNKAKTVSIIDQSCHVAQHYLAGLAMMIFCLWVMYGVGFSIVGVKNALFFAVLCGLLEIVPFVGNLTGTTLTVLMVVVQGGGGGMVAGVVITYAIIQFVQTYLLEPLVVGAEVNINPLFTIIVLVIGEMIWGISGMILAIPLTGILKIILENIEPLHPYAFLIGEQKSKVKTRRPRK